MTEEEKKGLKIAIVDDDKFLLNMYAAKFTKSGFHPDTFEGTEALYEKIKSDYKPDVLLLDIIMPSMTGLELVEKIKTENLLPNTIIVMLTNQSDSEDIQKAKNLKVEGYIVKATSIPSEVVEEVTKIIQANKKS